MRVLIAEDDPVSQRLLQATLQKSGYEVIVTQDGAEAWELLRQEDSPRLAVVDWMMPQVDGVSLCRRVKHRRASAYVYIILLTAKGEKSDIVAGLDAGADDYLVKPFDAEELRSRLKVGRRVLQLQDSLKSKIDELQHALDHVKQLQGILPICMHCKKIRDDKKSWHRLENYLEDHAHVMLTHSLCDDCLEQHYPDQADHVRERIAKEPA